MKKRASIDFILILGVIFIIGMLTLSGVYAANDTTSGSTTSSTQTTQTSSSSDSRSRVDKAYSCLETQVKNKASNALSLQEAAFSILALGSKTNLIDRINADAGANCWPKAGCKVKETAQMALVYKRIGKDSTNIEKWLGSKNASSNDLLWSLEIDISNHGPASCTVKYDGSERKINVAEDMTLSGSPGSCFSISSSGYWLNVKESCFDKEFQISCDQDFITTLLYQKRAGTTVYVSQETHSQASLGTTSERVSARCFKNDANCDYEGTLWAAFALNKAGKDVSAYIPYLVALSEDNQKYFPSAMLYILTSGNDQYSEIIQNQKQGKFWDIVGSPYNLYYDTSLGMLGLSGSSSVELENTKNYLLGIQTADGCWNNNNIRDTAFLLYAGWPKNVPSSGGDSSGGSSLCTAVSGQSCEIGSECTSAGGRVLNNFECPGFGVCCSVKVEKQTCRQQNGEICSSGEKCDGRIAQSSDQGTCCLDSCVPNAPQQGTCELSGASCRASCTSGEEEDSSKTCSNSGNVCCVESQSSGSWVWIVLLIILIVLVVLAIMYRDKLRVWWFKFRGTAKVTPVVRPGVPPQGFGLGGYRPPARPYAPPRPAQSAPQRAPVRKQPSPKDKELEDTLKKLKEMSK